MANIRRAILGIELHLDEIRAVEARTGIGGVVVTSVSSIAMPPFATENGRVKDRAAIIEALKTLVTQMDTKARSAIVGIPAQAVAIRTMDLPKMPEAELRAVMQGEIQHLQILTEPGGAFDFTEIDTGQVTTDIETRFLVMATEESVLTEYRDVMSAAGIQVSVFEPITIGLYRAAYSVVQTQPCAMALMITELKTEVAIVLNGKIAFYRRLNIGTDDLNVEGETVSEGEAPPITDISVINTRTASQIATEIRRSLDFFRRQHTDAPDVPFVVLAASNPRISALRDWLAQSLQVEVSLAVPPRTASTNPNLAMELEPPTGLRFVAAAGLAGHVANTKPGLPPRFDLIDPQRILMARQRIKLMLSMGLSVFFLLIGIGASGMLGRQAGSLANKLTQSRMEIDKLNTELKSKSDLMLRRSAQLTSLSKEGVPLPYLVDNVAKALDPAVNLQSLRVDSLGALVLSGLAKTQDAVGHTRDNLQKYVSPYATIEVIDENMDIGYKGTWKYVIHCAKPVTAPPPQSGPAK